MSVKLKNIYTGWAKHLEIVDATEEEKELAKARVAICVNCEHAREQWLSKFIDKTLKKDVLGSGIGCGLCGCPVNQKALVREEQCPINKW